MSIHSSRKQKPDANGGDMNGEKYKKLVCSLGCIVTGNQECVPHHVKCFNRGAGKVSDFLVIPLHPSIHTMDDDSYHRNRPLFEDRHGREVDLLAKTIQAVVEHLKGGKR